MSQAGISGNKDSGCDAIIVSGLREGGQDTFDKLVYVADKKAGAGRLLFSMKNQIPIRVFRSSILKNEFAAESKEKRSYRYDGLYACRFISNADGPRKVSVSNPPFLLVDGHQYKFYLERLEVGNDNMSNRISTEEMKLGIECSRGQNKKRMSMDGSSKMEPKKKMPRQDNSAKKKGPENSTVSITELEEKARILAEVPDEHKRKWGQIAFAKWGNYWFPCLIVDPYDVEPTSKMRSEWMKMFEKVSTTCSFCFLPSVFKPEYSLWALVFLSD